MPKKRKNTWRPTMPTKNAKYDLSNMSRDDIEKISLNNARRIVRGKDKLKSWGQTGKINTRFGVFKYRSKLERDILITLNHMNDFVVAVQTEKIIIPYFYHGTTHHYVPDLLIKLNNNKVWLAEIKPLKMISEEQNQAKFFAANEWCNKYGKHIKFCILTNPEENEIRKILLSHDGESL